MGEVLITMCPEGSIRTRVDLRAPRMYAKLATFVYRRDTVRSAHARMDPSGHMVMSQGQASEVTYKTVQNRTKLW